MKKLTLFAIMSMLVILASCGETDPNQEDPNTYTYRSFIGTWGVKQIDYYNIDFFGNPIEGSRETYYFTPGDMENGIDLVFRENKTGEMRDRSRDTLYLDYNDSTEIYETVIVCPDTTLVTPYTFSFNAEDNLLFLNMQVEHPFIYQMLIEFVDENTFIYENEYDNNYVEHARMVRYSTDTRGTQPQPVNMKRHPGSLFSH